MAKDSFADKSAGARLRGAIQRGETGEKVPGFDPAAAPYETDAEAGGIPLPVDCDPTLRSVKLHDSNASSHGSSLRAWPARDPKPASRDAPMREGPAYLIWWLIIAAGIIGYLLFSWVWQ